MRLGIAADHGGFELKEQLKQELKTLGQLKWLCLKGTAVTSKGAAVLA